MYPGAPRILSRPVRVDFAGFESNTYVLQQCGWEISMNQDVYSGKIGLALRHQGLQLHGFTDFVNHDYERAIYGGIERHVFRIVRMFYEKNMNFEVIRSDDWRMACSPVDCQPQMTTREIKSMEDFAIFATPLTRTQEIIVDPNDVNELMERILKLQMPEQDAIHARKKLRESREGYVPEYQPRQNFHAQILSIAA